MNNIPTISVVIPVKNEGSKIKACIEGILNQSVPVKEIIVIDSGSTDNTISILKNYPTVRLIEIPSSEFNHGLTRNVGVQAATGEFCVLTVGDARAVNNHWIKNMLDHFADPAVAGVCGQQVVPHETDKNPVDWFRPISAPEIRSYQFTNPNDFHALSADQKKVVCGWDDVTAMYRRDVLLAIPFRKTLYAEDALWARDALLAGHKIVYNPAARVYHYHLEDTDFTFKKCFTVFYHRYKFFDLKPAVSKGSIIEDLRMVKTLVKESKVNWKDKYKWLKYNYSLKKNTNKAIIAFNEALSQGDNTLDVKHQELCGAPPIPKKTY